MPEQREIAEERCEHCGLVVAGGAAGCQAIFDGLLARDFSDASYFAFHQMMVDTYSLQHPDRYCKSPKSFAAHLTGLCWLLARGASRSVGSESLRRWLDGATRVEKPPVVGQNSIRHVCATPRMARPASTDHGRLGLERVQRRCTNAGKMARGRRAER